LLAATPAPGTAAEEESDLRPIDIFTVKASNGYRLFVVALFQPGYGESSDVYVAVGHKGRGVSYLAPGTVTDRRVYADLGALGKVDVAFDPTGEIGVVHPSCDRDYDVRYEKGSYVGTIEFRGEEGFSNVSAKRARQVVQPTANIGCGSSANVATFGPDLPGAGLTATARTRERRVELQVTQNRPGAPVRVEAGLAERRGRIQILRQVELIYGPGSLRLVPGFRAATFIPPPPFSGAGHYRRDAKPANRWTGDLEVDFPGLADFSLTGARFHSSLRHARLERHTFSS
jgi:hypothetical protein